MMRSGPGPEGPNEARIYDYLLGGKDNYAEDRQAAEELLEVLPAARVIARANRIFLRHAVETMAVAGIAQFLDIGSGLPTVRSTHEIAARLLTGTRVVYVDRDPVVAAHIRAQRLGDGVAVVEADMHDVPAVLDRAGQVLDLARPVGVLLLAVLHFTPHAADIVRDLAARLPVGSFIAISHGEAGSEQIEAAAQLYRDRVNGGVPRTRDQIAEMMDGLEMIGPGVVPAPEWSPDLQEPPASPPFPLPLLAAVARIST